MSCMNRMCTTFTISGYTTTTSIYYTREILERYFDISLYGHDTSNREIIWGDDARSIYVDSTVAFQCFIRVQTVVFSL
jgi:hypothetical protein